LAGFLIAFLGMAALYPMHIYDGRSVRQAWLWQYYLVEIQRATNSPEALGPTSGSSAAALTTALTHILVSGIAGAVVMAIGWATKKRPPTA
jgi:hypothetical protein